ncbi:replicative DNA helicase [Candidatus Albibeggiatoa sp. nov. NOAA]|uniref:replicative DNA helicase n=1 Tax=Candidatus Albibeggiatoa sp. nov. NOAA TaxID=3162724 RepID=UPI0032FDA016|nr:replicative DNA helicase [Thiotrichaceae bacterium]
MQDSSVLPFPNRASNAESFTPSKIAPHSSEAEQAVLGGLMLKSDAWLEIADVVSTEDFYHNNHKTIFEAVKTLLEEGHACNIITVKDSLEKQGIVELENKHIIEYLDELIQNTPSVVNVKAYANIVRKKSILRRLINVADKIASSAYDPTNNNENDILDKAEQMIFEIAEHGQKNQKGFIEIKDVLAQALDRIDTMFQQDEAITGVPTGFTDFDELTSGLQPSDMVIVAGRPSMGKCLTADSEILLSDGNIATIEQLYQQKQAHLLTLNDDFKLQLTHASEFVDDGIKPVFKVKTRLGRSIETTLSHPFLTISGWKPLAELKVGDKVAVPRVLPVFGSNILETQSFDKDETLPSRIFKLNKQSLVVFLQNYIGDWTKKTICWQHQNCTLVKQIQHLLLRFGVMTQLSQINNNKWQLQQVDTGDTKQDVYWDEIVAIEEMGHKQVYDLTIPDTHNFIANDICVHNTSFAMNIAEYVAIKVQNPVAVFSMEMPAEQLGMRLIASLARVNQQRVRTGKLEDDDWPKITTAISILSEAPLFIDDTPALTPTEMRARARRLAREHGQLGLIVIDYLQLMQGSGKGDNRANEVSEISRSLKALAKELNVPVVALSQLNRSVEQRSDKRPMMSDLRESGCLTGDSLIYLPEKNTYVPIKELVGKTGFQILALNTETWKLEPAPVSNAFSTGVKPVYRLKTQLGRTIRATGNHKFLTINGWKHLDELQVGETIALPRKIDSTVQAETLTKNELALLGHLIGDGCTLPRHAIQYTTKEKDLAETVATLSTNIFGDQITPRIKQERSWYQVYLSATQQLSRRTRNPIAQWLDELGIFGLRSYEKRLPTEIFAQFKDSIGLFLRHLWATDGSILLSKLKQTYKPNIYYASSSQTLATGVQSLLLRLGINARLSSHSQGSKGRDQYHVTISGKSDTELFINQVGAVGAYKTQSLFDIQSFIVNRTENTNRDIIPRDIWRKYVVPAMQTQGLTSRQFQANLGIAYNGTSLYKNNLSRARASQVAQIVHSDDVAKLAESDVYWDKVVSVEYDGEEEVFDLTVPKLHNFIANDIVVHNSIEQDADLIVFIYRDEVYNEDSDAKGTAEIIVGKQRNGPIGTVRLAFVGALTKFENYTEEYHYDDGGGF